MHKIGSFLSNEKIKQVRTYFNMLNVYWHYYDTVIMIIVDITVWEILPNMLYLCTDIILKLINLLLIVSLFSFIISSTLHKSTVPVPWYSNGISW